MGLGAWANKSDWPITWISSVICTKVLGIYYCINYDDTLNKNWEIVENKLRSRIEMLSKRYLSIYQKAIIVNTLVLSKLWYLTHVFEIQPKWIKSFNSNRN